MSWIANPFLHYEPSRIYDPLTDRALTPGDGQYEALRAFVAGGNADPALVDEGWVVPPGSDPWPFRMIACRWRQKSMTTAFNLLKAPAVSSPR